MKPTIDQDLAYLENIVRKYKTRSRHRKLYKLIVAYTLVFGLGMLTMAAVISQEIRSLDSKIAALEAATLKTSAPPHHSNRDELL